MQKGSFHKEHLRGSSSLQETKKRPDESLTLPVLKRRNQPNELQTFVEAKWATAKLIASRILIGNIILFGFIELNQFVGNAIGTRSANTLAAENDNLRQPLRLMSPRLNNLEMQARKLNEPAIELHVLLQRPELVGNGVLSFTNSTEGIELQSFIPTPKSFHP